MNLRSQSLSLDFKSTFSYVQSRILNNDNKIKINEVIEFEEQIQSTYFKLIQLLQKKNEFIKILSADFIDLVTLEQFGNQLTAERDDILIDFEKLYFQNKSNYLLLLLMQTFQVALSFRGQKQLLIKNTKKYYFFSYTIRLHFQKNTNTQHLPLRFQYLETSQKSQLYSQKSVVVFVSIKKENLGQIKKISNNIEQIFGYTKEEVLNQNCQVLMPSNLGKSHNMLIENMINRGSIQKTLNSRINPLIAKTKQQLLVPVDLQLQVSHFGIEDIGISGLITLNKSYNQNHIVLDLSSKEFSLRVDGFTLSIFQQLFQTIFYFENQSDYFKIKASKIFPLLPFLIESFKNKDQKQEHFKSQTFEMIGFFPFDSRQLLIKNQNEDLNNQNDGNIQDYKRFLINSIKKQEFSTYNNSLFQCQVFIQFFQEESLQYCQISINSFFELNLQDFQKGQIKYEMQKQFQEFGNFSFTMEEIDEYFGIQNISLNKVFSHGHSPKRYQSSRQITFKKGNHDTELQNFSEQIHDSFSTFRILESDKRFISQGDQQNINSFQKQDSRKMKKKLSNLKNNNYQTLKLNLCSGDQYPEKIDMNENEDSQEIQLNSNKVDHQFDGNSGQSIDYEISQLKKIQSHHEPHQEISLKNIEIIQKSMKKISNESLSSQYNNLNNMSIAKNNLISPSSSDQHFLRSVETNLLSQTSLNNLGVDKFQDAKRLQQNQKPKQLILKNNYIKLGEQLLDNKLFSKYYDSKVSENQSFVSEENDIDLSKEIKSIQNMSISTTSKSSAEKSKKKVLIHQILKKKSAPLYILIKIFTVVSICKYFQKQQTYNNSYFQTVSIFSVMLAEYLVLSDQFDKQIRNFSYISWAQDARVTLTRTFSNEQFKILVDHPIFINSYQNKEQHVAEYNQYIQKLVQFYKDLVDNIYLEKRSDLVLIEYMVEQDISIKYFLSAQNAPYISVKLLYNILFHYSSIVEYTKNIPSSPLEEAFLFQNFQNQTTTLSLMQNLQQQSVSDSFTTILNIVEQLLIIISVITGVLLILSYNSYIYSQIKKTQILKLLSTLDPLKLHEMNKILIQSSQILFSENSQAFLFQGFRTKKSKIQKNIEIAPIPKKKKLTLQTNKLPLFNFKVYFLSFGIFILILIYPITNLLITLNLISQSNNNQNLIGNLEFFIFIHFLSQILYIFLQHNFLTPLNQFQKNYSIIFLNRFPKFYFCQKIQKNSLTIFINLILIKYLNKKATIENIKAQAASNMGAYSLYLVSQLYPSLKVTPISQYRTRYYRVITTNSAMVSGFRQNITEQQSYSRYQKSTFDNFLFQSIEKDSCEIFNNYYQDYKVKNYEFDFSKCQKLFNGVFQSGLLNTIQSYIEPFNQIYQIDSIQEYNQWYNQINYFFNKEYNFLEIKEVFEMIILMLDTLNQFIHETNVDFFSLMQTIQTSLMIYQIIILTITFLYLFFYYFNSLQDSIENTKKTISLIEAKCLYENHYVLNHFKQ